jgi:hypothetical protein
VLPTLLAGIGIVLCVLLLVRLGLGPRRQARVDAVAKRLFGRMKRAGVQGWRWPGSRRKAARMAEEAIRRARERRSGDGQWDGNVYKPKSFKRPRKPH